MTSSDGSTQIDGSMHNTDGPTTTDGPSGSDASADATQMCSFANQRMCVDSTHAGSCDATLQLVIDRACPPTSMCAGGHCQPPAGSSPCQKASDCSSGVCDLYVVGATLTGRCTPVEGTGGAYANCAPAGNDAMCQSGICALDGADSSHQQCLVPCRSGMDSDCPGGNSCHPIGKPTTIEGVSVTGWACFN